MTAGTLAAFRAGLPCNQFPPSICFSASCLSSGIMGVGIAVGGGWNNSSQGLLPSLHSGVVQMTRRAEVSYGKTLTLTLGIWIKGKMGKGSHPSVSSSGSLGKKLERKWIKKQPSKMAVYFCYFCVTGMKRDSWEQITQIINLFFSVFDVEWNMQDCLQSKYLWEPQMNCSHLPRKARLSLLRPTAWSCPVLGGIPQKQASTPAILFPLVCSFLCLLTFFGGTRDAFHFWKLLAMPLSLWFPEQCLEQPEPSVVAHFLNSCSGQSRADSTWALNLFPLH